MEFLTGPILAVLGVLGLAVVTDPQSVDIGHISVPTTLADAGYTPQVVEVRLVEEMRRIEEEAKSTAETRSLASDGKPSLAATLGETFGALEFVRSVQANTGLIAYSFDGEIVAKGDRLQFALRGEGHDARGPRASSVVRERPAAEIDELIADVALDAMAVVDPYIRAAYQFAKDLPGGDFTATRTRIDLLLAEPQQRSRLWGTNLKGMVLAIEGNRAGALAEFERALTLDPGFTPSLLNRGILLAQDGRHADAIATFRQVIALPPPADAPKLHAAAYTEWGISLVSLGHMKEAEDAFRYAIDIHPEYGEAYEKWAELLMATNRPDAAAEKQRLADRHRSVTIVHTDQLIGYVKDRIASLGRN